MKSIELEQLPIDLTPMVALAYLYHGSSEFYVEDVFALSESREGSCINDVSTQCWRGVAPKRKCGCWVDS